MMLELRGIKKTFTTTREAVAALDGVSLAVRAGEILAVYGSSGSGKSTLLLTAGGLLSPDAGTVQIGGENPYALAPDQRSAFRAKQIGFVFQQFHLIPYLDVRDNVLTAAREESAEIRERATGLLDELGLKPRLRHYPDQLSVGEQQRVALVRAMINQPPLILADEPTGNLDNRNSEIVLEQLQAFAASGGAVMIVTHDPRVLEAAQRSVNLENGKMFIDDDDSSANEKSRVCLNQPI